MPLRSSKIRVAYILAASHSGSTLLTMLLNAHSEVCTVGELKATSLGDVDRYRCSCKRKIKECYFWNSIAKVMTERGFDFDISKPGTDIRSGASPYVLRLLRPLHRGSYLEGIRDLFLQFSLTWRTQLPRIQSINTALMDSVLCQTNKKVIADSSKIGIRLKYLLRNPNLDIKIIRLIRDGRAVSLTYINPATFADAQDSSLRGGGVGGRRESERLSMEQAAREWRRSNEEAEALLNQVKKTQWIEIRYEDLCQAPEKTLAFIFSFFGVSNDQINLDFRAAEHHIIGNGMRLDGNCHIVLDDRWKTQLSRAQLQIFQRVAGDLNERLGYK